MTQIVMSCFWYVLSETRTLCFTFFSAHTEKSDQQSYIFICFLKLTKMNIIEFLSWSQWKMISLNCKDLIGGLVIVTSKSCFLKSIQTEKVGTDRSTWQQKDFCRRMSTSKKKNGSLFAVNWRLSDWSGLFI